MEMLEQKLRTFLVRRLFGLIIIILIVQVYFQLGETAKLLSQTETSERRFGAQFVGVIVLAHWNSANRKCNWADTIFHTLFQFFVCSLHYLCV